MNWRLLDGIIVIHHHDAKQQEIDAEEENIQCVELVHLHDHVSISHNR